MQRSLVEGKPAGQVSHERAMATPPSALQRSDRKPRRRRPAIEATGTPKSAPLSAGALHRSGNEPSSPIEFLFYITILRVTHQIFPISSKNEMKIKNRLASQEIGRHIECRSRPCLCAFRPQVRPERRACRAEASASTAIAPFSCRCSNSGKLWEATGCTKRSNQGRGNRAAGTFCKPAARWHF